MLGTVFVFVIKEFGGSALTTVPGMIADRMAGPARPFAHSRGEPTFPSCTFWQSEKLNKNAACIRRGETEDAYQLAVRQPSVSIHPRKRNLPGKGCGRRPGERPWSLRTAC
jgi:hypothetical protein